MMCCHEFQSTLLFKLGAVSLDFQDSPIRTSSACSWTKSPKSSATIRAPCCTWRTATSSLLSAGEQRRCRGGNLQLMEVLTIFWGERPEIPRRDRLVYKLGAQTNEGNLLSAIQYQPWPQCWALPFSKKKELFGPFRRPVGGTTALEGVDEEVEEQCQAVRRSRFFPLCALMGVRRCQATADASAVEELPGATGLAVNAGRGSCAKRVDTNLEPVFFHSWHEQAAEAVFRRLVLWFWLCLLPLPNFDQVYKELCHGFCIKALVDDFAGSGVGAPACMKMHTPYTGVCFNDAHKELLLDHLKSQAFAEMQDSTSELYDRELAEAMAGAAGGGAPAPQPHGRGRGGRARRPQRPTETGACARPCA